LFRGRWTFAHEQSCLAGCHESNRLTILLLAKTLKDEAPTGRLLQDREYTVRIIGGNGASIDALHLTYTGLKKRLGVIEMMKEIADVLGQIPLVAAVILLGLCALFVGATGSLPVGDVPLLGTVWRAVFVAIGLALVGLGLWGLVCQICTLPGSLVIRKPEFHTFNGIRRELRTGDVFQDFVRRPNDNINAVYYLWADAFKGSRIEASVQEGAVLRIKFDNQPGSYPCNVAIRPQSEQALKRDEQKHYLSFEARIAEESAKDVSLLAKVAIGVRLVDGWLQHWQYTMYPNECMQFELSNREWEPYHLPLDEPEKWRLFEADGNHFYGPKKPDFKIIASVIFEVGGYGGPGRPAGGKGIIDIRGIRLTSYAK